MLFHHLGAYGKDIASDPENAVEHVNFLSKQLLENGVTDFCLTIIPAISYQKVSSHDYYHNVVYMCLPRLCLK